MKLKSAFPLLLLCTLAAPVLAETTTGTPLAESCPLIGPLDGATEECRALRVTYRAEVAACMDQMRAEADARAGRLTMVNSHTNRARFVTCDAATRMNLGLASK